jgi:hypothetical protein
MTYPVVKVRYRNSYNYELGHHSSVPGVPLWNKMEQVEHLERVEHPQHSFTQNGLVNQPSALLGTR